MAERRQGPLSYRRAQYEARAKAGDLSEEALASVVRVLDQYATELSARVKSLPHGSEQHRIRAVEEARRITMLTSETLRGRLELMTGRHRTMSFEEVLQVWQDAGEEAARIKGLPGALLGAIRTPNLTMLGAYENLGGASKTYQSLIRSHVRSAQQDVNNIIQQAITQGVSPDELSKRLRPYVKGAEEFHEAFGGISGVDWRNLRTKGDPKLRDAARKLKYNADRIAFSEIHNARAEAELQHFAADPLVDAVIWRLSPFRGRLGGPDVCDGLATVDAFGLGPGVYPLDAVPLPPHPFDRCERVPRTREAEDAGDAKPAGEYDPRARGRFKSPTGRRLSGAEQQRLNQLTHRTLEETLQHPSRRVVQEIVTRSEVSGPTPLINLTSLPSMPDLKLLKEAVEDYDTSGYRMINGVLRGVIQESDDPLIRERNRHNTNILKQAIAASPRFNKQPIVYRGIDAKVYGGLDIGAIIDDKGFTSISLDEEVAFARARGQRTVLHIKVPVGGGPRALDFKLSGRQGGEDEFLMAPGTKLRITRALGKNQYGMDVFEAEFFDSIAVRVEALSTTPIINAKNARDMIRQLLLAGEGDVDKIVAQVNARFPDKKIKAYDVIWQRDKVLKLPPGGPGGKPPISPLPPTPPVPPPAPPVPPPVPPKPPVLDVRGRLDVILAEVDKKPTSARELARVLLKDGWTDEDTLTAVKLEYPDVKFGMVDVRWQRNKVLKLGQTNTINPPITNDPDFLKKNPPITNAWDTWKQPDADKVTAHWLKNPLPLDKIADESVTVEEFTTKLREYFGEAGKLSYFELNVPQSAFHGRGRGWTTYGDNAAVNRGFATPGLMARRRRRGVKTVSTSSIPQNRIRLWDEMTAKVRRFLAGSRSRSDYEGVETLIHELLHSVSFQNQSRYDYAMEAGRFIEEGLTQWHTHRIGWQWKFRTMDRSLIDWQWQHSKTYPREVEFVDNVARFVGDDVLHKAYAKGNVFQRLTVFDDAISDKLRAAWKDHYNVNQIEKMLVNLKTTYPLDTSNTRYGLSDLVQNRNRLDIYLDPTSAGVRSLANR